MARLGAVRSHYCALLLAAALAAAAVAERARGRGDPPVERKDQTLPQ